MNEDKKDLLPPIIVGALPSPKAVRMEHRVVGQNFSPDGKSRRCSCGFETRTIQSDDELEMEFLSHLE